MADEEGQEKTEAPTPRKLDKAREEGQVPRSQELNTAVVILAGAAGLAAFGGPLLAGTAADTLRQTMGLMSAGDLTAESAVTLIRDLARVTLTALVPVMLAVTLPVALIGGIQARGIVALKPIAPSLARLSPLAGFTRIFGTQALFTLFKSIVKLTALGLVTWLALRGLWPSLAELTGAEAPAVVEAARAAILKLVTWTGLTFLVAAGLDYGYEMWQHGKKLRMTRQEIVQEHRESEGDPHVKSRIKSLQQAMSRKRMLHKVKDADVVIVNPTSIAVALRYDPTDGGAPVVLAMGRRKLAERIRTLATDHGVPIVRNVPVARALIASGKIGKAIPPALYAAVAEVLAFVYRQRGKLPQALRNRKAT